MGAPPRCSNALNRPFSLRSLPNVAPTTALRSPCRLLWGIPGRSNALNIAQRLGLEQAVVDAARAKLGAAAAEVGWWRKELAGDGRVWGGAGCGEGATSAKLAYIPNNGRRLVGSVNRRRAGGASSQPFS